MNPTGGLFGDVNQNLTEVADEYKKMSLILIVFCGIAAIGIVVVSIAIFRQTK